MMGILFIFLGAIYWLVFVLFYKGLKQHHPAIWEKHHPNFLVWLNVNPFFFWDVFLISGADLRRNLKTALWVLRALTLLVLAFFLYFLRK